MPTKKGTQESSRTRGAEYSEKFPSSKGEELSVTHPKHVFEGVRSRNSTDTVSVRSSPKPIILEKKYYTSR